MSLEPGTRVGGYPNSVQSPRGRDELFSIRTQGFVANQPHNVEVAANGKKFLVNAIVGDSDNSPIEITLNWANGLKK